MIKSIFAGMTKRMDKYAKLKDVRANHLIVPLNSLNPVKWRFLKSLGMTLGISIDSFGQEFCPLDPSERERLHIKIYEALKRKPNEIWFDHFRFHGHWENQIEGVHGECVFCKGRERDKEIEKAALWAKKFIPKEVKAGYFAVPFKKEEMTVTKDLGQNHEMLTKIFDMISPMLYHRMIKKSVSYISEYVKYLYKFTKKPILPIIQVKDMPDELPDRLGWGEFKSAFSNAKNPPSSGVSIFLWEHAAEVGKEEWIKRMFLF